MTDLMKKLIAEGTHADSEPPDGIVKPLEQELSWIINPDIKQMTRLMLAHSVYFWESASADQPDHYPPDEYGKGGIVLHTKRTARAVFYILHSKFMPEDEISVLISAALLHAVCRPLAANNPEKPGVNIYDPNYMISIDSLLAQVAKSDEFQMWDLDQDRRDKLEELMGVVLRLVHCCEGALSPIEELVPSNTLEVMLASANLVAKSLHLIVDGENVIEERWQVGTELET